MENWTTGMKGLVDRCRGSNTSLGRRFEGLRPSRRASLVWLASALCAAQGRGCLRAALAASAASGAPASSRAATPPPISESCRVENRVHLGYAFAGIMFFSKCLEGVFQAWHAHLMTRSALRARSGLITLIYRKCLWLTGLGGEDASYCRPCQRRQDEE